MHGNLYHVKLLTLFFIRGTTAGYDFRMGNEVTASGKFDDLVFQYSVIDSLHGKKWRYRHLQAKHKLDESMRINLNQLLVTRDNDFSLGKYFCSYLDIVAALAKNEELQDCIICSNIGFDEASFRNSGLELVQLSDPEPILNFQKLPSGKLPARYKLQFTTQDFRKELNLHLNELYGFIGSRKFRTFTYQEIDGFFEKLVFVVNTPNESELDLLRNEEISKYFKLHSELQSAYVFNEMLDWFKYPKSEWMTLEDGKNLLERTKNKMESIRVATTSTEYLNELQKILEFNNDTVCGMAEKLESFLQHSSNKLVRITSPIPKCTAAKVIAALKKLPKRNCHHGDCYLVMSSRFLQNKDETERWKKTFDLNDPHRFLVIVYEDDDAIQDDDQYYLNLILNGLKDQTVILVASKVNIIKGLGKQDLLEDTITYRQLSESSKNCLMSKRISFQGADLFVKDLIGDTEPDDVINLVSIEELIHKRKDAITIPSFNAPCTENFLQISRRLALPFLLDPFFRYNLATAFKNQLEELREGEYIKINSQGSVEWIGGDWDRSRKSKLWEKMKCIVDKNLNSTEYSLSDLEISEEELLSLDRRWPIIISGLAGTGKSTILSHFYERIRKVNPNTWVIRINLAEHSQHFLKFNYNPINGSSAIDFVIDNFPAVTGNSQFARLLLRHRLETVGQIVLMMDGFDETDCKVQEKILEFVNAISQTKLDRLYITARAHVVDQLEGQLFQFAFSLVNFSREDQVNYFCDYWQTSLNIPLTEPGRQLAKSLVHMLPHKLNGIPLQCRIMAECFKSRLEALIKNNEEAETVHMFAEEPVEERFTLSSMYKMFFDTKRRVFLQEKANVPASNKILTAAVDMLTKRIESYLTKFAIDIIAVDQEDADVLWPSSTHQSQVDRSEEDKTIVECSLIFGMTHKVGIKNEEVQFINRTFAEYLLAKHLYEGLLLDDDSHNKLLEKEPARQLIFAKILVHEDYHVVRLFLDDMLYHIVKSEEWRILLHEDVESLPVRLKKVYTEETLIPQSDDTEPKKYTPKKMIHQAVSTAVIEKHKNLFKFLCDGLDATMERAEVRKLLNCIFFDNFRLYKQEDYYDQNSDILKQCVDFYDDAQANEVEEILIPMMHNGSQGRIKMMKVSQPNQLERRRNLKTVLDFMDKHKMILKDLQKKKDYRFEEYKSYVLQVLICNEYYVELLNQFVKLLSWLYTDKKEDSWLIKLLNFALDKCSGSTNPSDDSIKFIILKTLRDLGRLEVVNGISYLILKWNPNPYEHFHELRIPQEEEKNYGLSDGRLLFVEDLDQKKLLHRAAFDGDLETLKRILDKARDNILSQTGKQKKKKMVDKVVDFYSASYTENLTPLHVAATRGHKEIVHAIYKFLMKIIPDHKLRKDMTKKNGFLHRTLMDAIRFTDAQMFELLLRSVKEYLGKSYLLDLLEPHTNILVQACNDANLFKILAEILGEVGAFKELNDLILKNGHNNVRNLRYVEIETFEGMLTVSGCRDWLKRLFETDLVEGFVIISHHFENLDESLISQIVKTIMFASDGQKSYWAHWLLQEFNSQRRPDSIGCYKKLTAWIFKNLGEKEINNLLTQDCCKPIIRVLLLCPDDNPANAVLDQLSNKNRKEVGMQIIKKLSSVMRDTFIEKKSFLLLKNVLQLIVDYANNHQLSKLVNTMTYEHDFNGSKLNIWGTFLTQFYSVENNIDRIDQFFRCVSEKLGENILKNLILDDSGKAITRALLRYDDSLVKVTLAYLSKEAQDEVGKCVVENAPQIMEDIFVDPTPHSPDLRWLNISQLIVNYADVPLLSKFIQVITVVHKQRKKFRLVSMWGDCFKNFTFYRHLYNMEEKMNEFLKCVSEKLGESIAKDLVLHKDRRTNCFPAIVNAVWEGGENVVIAMVAYLKGEVEEETLSILNILGHTEE